MRARPVLVLLPLLCASGSDGPLRAARPPIPWSVAIHGGEVGHDLGLAAAAFDHVAHLGFTGVRTDIFWHEVEPARDQWDPGMVAFHVGYVELARERELDPLVILSGAPGWAADLYESDEAAFWLEYEDYVRRVLFLVAPEADTYQLWNEPNHFIDPIDADDDWQLIARAGALVRELDPTARTSVNVMANLPGWQAALDDWVTQAGEYIDIIGVDHYPGTWACCTASDWGPLETLITRINTPGDLWFGKRGALMETGFSSWAFFADEQDQADWIDQALPEIRARLDADVGRRMVLCNYYQLIDVNTGGWGQEAHFGIVHTDGTPKVGYAVLAERLAGF
ncbi:MAG: hypothetical protein QF903_07325 [Planctomycetota bacterium]|jgi:hypothetical protein|nr:hypothetical protein [Planctomycetota bacterium]MDP6762460.1 hypothetical protein [Planctomycetota bacterium]MDP6989276.1 hypothetical protein [Planctomycetota bacterium]